MQSLMKCLIFRNLLLIEPGIASTSTTVFVPPSNNVNIENNDVKIDLASENLDKGKSILGAPLK